MSITSFIYRSNLGLVYKESLSRIVAFLGVPISESAGKPTMIEKIDSYVKSNPIEVLEKLCEGTGTGPGVCQGESRYPCGKSFPSDL